MSLGDLDRVLRADRAGGPTARPGRLALTAAALAAGYGACMGVYALTRPDGPEWRQVAASAAKVPALVGLTVGVTFPSLYVFNCLLGGRLGLGDLARLVSSAVGVLAAVLAALGPVVGFFSVTTASYPFVLLLNVGVFAAASGFGGTALRRMLTAHADTLPGQADAAGGRVFVAWMLLFAVVGAQAGWVLRPFVGSPSLPFTWFRPRSGSVGEAVLASVRAAVGQ